MYKILVTGSSGFIGKNLCLVLEEQGYKILRFNRKASNSKLIKQIKEADSIVHLAGCNRTNKEKDFYDINFSFTENLIKIVTEECLSLPIIFTSSIQSSLNNSYGISKKYAEEVLIKYSKVTGNKSIIFKLPNVFGKWCKPNYNSFVATFCHNIVKGKPINIHDDRAEVSLIYIDDLCKSITASLKACISNPKGKSEFKTCTPIYKSTVGSVARKLYSFQENKDKTIVSNTGKGLDRALYSTYLSYFEPNDFSYNLPIHSDKRGLFSEFIQTKSAGQVSFFTALPNQTRGMHYHHTKNERFLIIAGKGVFTFKNVITQEKFKINVKSSDNKIIQSIPGWAHSIKNTGNDVLIALLWANELFNEHEPDTYFKEI